MFMIIGCGTRLATYGYAVIGIDYEGHGRSGGSRCYIQKFDNIINDCSNFFKSVCGKHPHLDPELVMTMKEWMTLYHKF